MPGRDAIDRRPVLPSGSPTFQNRRGLLGGRGERGGIDAILPTRGGPRVQLRVSSRRSSRLAEDFWSVLPALSRALSRRSVLARLRSTHPRLVRARTSRRGFRRDLCRLVDAYL